MVDPLNYLLLTYVTLFSCGEQDVALGESVRSWCDGSSDRSFMVDSVSYLLLTSVTPFSCGEQDVALL